MNCVINNALHKDRSILARFVLAVARNSEHHCTLEMGKRLILVNESNPKHSFSELDLLNGSVAMRLEREEQKDPSERKKAVHFLLRDMRRIFRISCSFILRTLFSRNSRCTRSMSSTRGSLSGDPKLKG